MPPASDNVFISDLPVGMDKGSLQSLFEAYGAIQDCRILPGKTDEAKPCAMMRFGSVEIASWVVDNLNGNIPEGLQEPVQVRYANAPAKGGKDGGKGGDSWGGNSWGGKGDSWAGKGVRVDPYPAKGGAKGGANAPSDNVWIGDLPLGTTGDDLASIFGAYGSIVQSRILPGRDASAKPCAMIRFAGVEMATWVVENLNGNIPEGLDGAIIARFANSSSGGEPKGGGKGAAVWQNPFGVVQPTWAGHPGGKGKGGGQPWDNGKGGGKGGNGAMGKGAAAGSFQSLFQAVKGAGVLGGGTAPEDCQIFIRNLPADTTDEGLYKLCSPFGAIPPTGVKAMLNPDGSCKGIGFVDFSEATSAATAVMALDGHTTPDGSMINVSAKKPSKGGKGKGGKD